MSDFCFGCGRHLEGGELTCPECGRLTDTGIKQGYVPPQEDGRKQRGILFLIMGMLLLSMAVSMMVFR